jgi:DNA processing protein
MQEEDRRALLALWRQPGLGPAKLFKLLNQAGCLSRLFNSQGYCEQLRIHADWQGVDRDCQWAEQSDCHLMVWGDPHYPFLLQQITYPPPVLFVRGDLAWLNHPQIAMVGSRKPSPQGSEIAFTFAQQLAELGLCITSGLAIGIDGASHRGALHARGGTIAVLGNGLDRIYPSSHRTLAHDIVLQGALVSEFPIGTPPLPAHFPRRNRIISGLSRGVLVIEAAIKSGSLISARYAAEQGREVFALPGSIGNPLSRGCHALIKEGALLVETVEDILSGLGVVQPVKLELDRPIVVEEALEESMVTVLNYVNFECTPVDLVVVRSGLTYGRVSALLLELELQGYILSVPGGYVRTLKLPGRNGI